MFRYVARSLRGTHVGCIGATLLVLVTAGGAFALVAMVWSLVAQNEAAPRPAACSTS